MPDINIENFNYIKAQFSEGLVLESIHSYLRMFPLHDANCRGLVKSIAYCVVYNYKLVLSDPRLVVHIAESHSAMDYSFDNISSITIPLKSLRQSSMCCNEYLLPTKEQFILSEHLAFGVTSDGNILEYSHIPDYMAPSVHLSSSGRGFNLKKTNTKLQPIPLLSFGIGKEENGTYKKKYLRK